MISAGRVLIVPRGKWNADATYHMLDLVEHNGYAYIAKRTVAVIEPSDERTDYWHNLFDVNTIVENAIAGTMADTVGDILEERFRDMLSEAVYASDLYANFEVPTFVRWDSKTQHTPYTEGLTTSASGFALVFGSVNADHTIISWTTGADKAYSFNHRYIMGNDMGWDSHITASGGTMTGPLGLGGGKGSVSADDSGAFIEAKTKRIKVKDTSLEESAKVVSTESGVEKEYNLFGEHNLETMRESGVACIETGSYEGSGKGGENYPSSLTFSFVPKLVIISAPTDKGGKIIAINGQESTDSILDTSSATPPSIYFDWLGKKLSWYSTKGSSYADKAESQLTKSGVRYHWIAIG